MRTKKLILCGLFTALIIVGAFIKIPFPGMPMTLQFAFVLLAGIILGPCWGALSVALYVILGLIGLPVFSSGGGLGYVIIPSFGYIIGFIVAAFVAGTISCRKPGSLAVLLAASFSAMLTTYIIGIVYFTLIKSFYSGESVDVGHILYSQVLLMAPKDIFMCVACSFLGKRLQFITATPRFR